jgi:predicted DNA-binding protein
MLGIRIHPDLKKLLQKLADKDGRSLSNYVNKIIVTYLKEHEKIDWEKPSKKHSP